MDVLYFSDIKPVMISIVIILNVTLNSLVIAVIVRYPQLREDRTTLFMISLTLSDLATGITSMPISALLCSSAIPTVPHALRHLPAINLICLRWFSVASLHSLCWVTVCKMVAIVRPLQYEQLFNKTRCYIIIAVTWLIGCLISTTGSHLKATWKRSLCTSIEEDKSHFTTIHRTIFVVAVAIPLVVIAYATTRIFCAIVRTHLQITAQVHSIGGDNVTVGVTTPLTLRSLRSGRNILLICAAVLVLTIPIVLYGVTVGVWGIKVVSPSYGFFAFWISLCNTFDNSLLYLVLFRSIRRKTADLLSALCELCRKR